MSTIDPKALIDTVSAVRREMDEAPEVSAQALQRYHTHVDAVCEALTELTGMVVELQAELERCRAAQENGAVKK